MGISPKKKFHVTSEFKLSKKLENKEYTN